MHELNDKIISGMLWPASLKLYLLKKNLINIDQLNVYPENLPLLKKIISYNQYIIYGLGKLFHDNFFKSYWNLALNPILFIDGKKELWGQKIHNIPIESPYIFHDLLLYKNITNYLIITWVKDDNVQRKILTNLGNFQVINAYEIFNIFKEKIYDEV